MLDPLKVVGVFIDQWKASCDNLVALTIDDMRKRISVGKIKYLANPVIETELNKFIVAKIVSKVEESKYKLM